MNIQEINTALMKIINYLLKLPSTKGATVVAFCALVIFASGCKENYFPEVTENSTGDMVIEGFINTGNDSTIIKISKTVKLAASTKTPEKGATVFVENDGGTTYALPEIKDGVYSLPRLNADPTKKYRLRIRTKANKDYVSDFVENKITPPITEVGYGITNDNLNIYVTADADATGNSGYYQYTYVETYHYQSAWRAEFKKTPAIVPLQKGEYATDCWRTLPSTNIGLHSTKNLNIDKVNHNIVVTMPSTSVKIGVRYSIIVTQNVLTKKGYDFWSAVRKNTEQIGGIFDSQPSQLYGNIHAVANPNELVLGFISAGTTSYKRIFIDRAQLPANWQPNVLSQNNQCPLNEYLFTRNGINEVMIYITNGTYYPVTGVYKDGLPAGYSGTPALKCVDCKAEGGSDKEPSFWR